MNGGGPWNDGLDLGGGRGNRKCERVTGGGDGGLLVVVLIREVAYS